MRSSIEEQTAPAAIRDPHDRFWVDVKASDEFLDRVFADYLRRLELPVSLLKKSDYHRLASFVPPELIDSEVVQVLDGILEVSRKARPVTSP